MGTVFLRGRSWVIEYRERNGRIKRESIGKRGVITKTQARAILDNRERQVKLGREGLSESEIPSLEDFAEGYLSYVRNTVKKRSWDRDELALKHLIDFFKGRILSDISPSDVDDYKTSRLGKVAPATVNRELQVLRHLFNLADRWNKFFGKNPVSVSGLIPVNNQKERILALDEEKRLIVACDPYLRNIVAMALYTGMRKGEIITLEWGNVDLESGLITVDQTNSKSKKTRRIPINSTVRRLLLEQRLKSAGNEYVFLSSKGTPYKKHDSLNRAYSLALVRAGIKGLRFHDLRHTAATRMIELGASVVAVKEILGHSSLDMTMRYAHPNESLRKALEGLSSHFSDSLTDKSTDTANLHSGEGDVSH